MCALCEAIQRSVERQVRFDRRDASEKRVRELTDFRLEQLAERLIKAAAAIEAEEVF